MGLYIGGMWKYFEEVGLMVIIWVGCDDG